jgi:hypothetical protein
MPFKNMEMRDSFIKETKPENRNKLTTKEYRKIKSLHT